MSAAANALAEALRDVLQSPNVSDSNGEPANIVDVLDGLGHSITFAAKHLGTGNAITDGWGALEAHRKALIDSSELLEKGLRDAAETVADGLHDVAEALWGRAGS